MTSVPCVVAMLTGVVPEAASCASVIAVPPTLSEVRPSGAVTVKLPLVTSLVPEGVEPDARSDSSTLPSVPPPLSLRPVIDGASGTASTVSVSVPVSVVVPSLTV